MDVTYIIDLPPLIFPNILAFFFVCTTKYFLKFPKYYEIIAWDEGYIIVSNCDLVGV